jgi:DNA polymerase-3 subunit gamma/tau
LLALARKYRPKNFASVAVQSHVSNTLRGAIARGRVAHGYLLCGPRGTGKTTLARVLAMALNCENRGADGEPCGICESCSRIWRGDASLDVVEIDAASNRGVDDARDLRERAMYAPSGDDRYKVYIVDEAHMLTREAWNALLKVLEEPPPHVVFVFATTEPQKIAQTAAPVLSRLQRFDLKRIGPAEIRERLAAVLTTEGVPFEPEALAMIARSADGGLRDALSLTDQVLSLGSDVRVTATRVREALGLVPEDEYLAVLDLIADRRASDVFATVGRLGEQGIDFGAFLTGLADMLRAQLAVALGGEAPDVSDHARQALEERRGRLGPSDLLRMLNAIVELEQRFRKSAQQQLLIETLLVRFALLDRAVALEDVLRGLAGGDGGGSGPARLTSALRETAPRSAPTPARHTAPAEDARSSGGAEARARVESPPLKEARLVAAPAESRASASLSAPAAVLDVVEPRPAELNQIVEEWDDVVDRLRESGKAVLATALDHCTPVAVTAQGVVTCELDEANDLYERAFESGAEDLLATLRVVFPAISRVALRRSASAAPASKQRLTHESLKTERLGSLRKKDPVLNAAIEELDLEVLE